MHRVLGRRNHMHHDHSHSHHSPGDGRQCAAGRLHMGSAQGWEPGLWWEPSWAQEGVQVSLRGRQVQQLGRPAGALG